MFKINIKNKVNYDNLVFKTNNYQNQYIIKEASNVYNHYKMYNIYKYENRDVHSEDIILTSHNLSDIVIFLGKGSWTKLFYHV
jgi:hypothetical protein